MIKKAYEEIKEIYPEYESYEDAYAMAMDESYPIKYILTGRTLPFPGYKNKRPPTKKFYIFEYIVSGKGYIFLNGKWHNLEEGDMYIIGKFDERNIYSESSDPMHKVWFSFSSEYIDSMLLHYGVNSGVYRVNVEEYFERIYETSKSAKPQKEKLFRVADNLHKIIMTAADTHKQEENGIISKIESELIASVYTKISLDEIAAKLFMSKANLIRIFKKHKGVTPYQFLLDERIKIAKALLLTTSMSVKSISEKLSFADEHYFSHLFKEKNGLSPLQYKQSRTTERQD
jgi:AraC-like DNA-binding protein